MLFCYLEKQDVHEFLLDNLNNGGILELMMRYLKVISQKFLVKWPPGLAEVVLSIYNSWRKHSSNLPNPLLRDCSNQHIKVMRLFGFGFLVLIILPHHYQYIALYASKPSTLSAATLFMFFLILPVPEIFVDPSLHFSCKQTRMHCIWRWFWSLYYWAYWVMLHL